MDIRAYFRDTKMILSGYARSFLTARGEKNADYPIDFVVTWVDGNDPEWRKERANYVADDTLAKTGNGVCRYRDWASFRYWFRAVEQFAPWVHCVYLVTWGHVPPWLNQDCPKLKIVRHEDFIPREFLPTFNCNTIELNLFRIPGLSEHFVYFNDDILLARPTSPEDFFINGLPRHTGVALPWINRDNEIPYHLFFNVFGIVNRKNHIRDCIEAHPEKFFSHVYARMIKYNIQAYRFDGLPGILFTHMGAPFCKTSMEQTWRKYEKECTNTCLYKFRDIHQLTHQIYSAEDILAGDFVPERNDWGGIVSIEDIEAIRRSYAGRMNKMICLSDRDDMTEEEVDTANRNLEICFEQIFPQMSMFEYKQEEK